jgi:UDP-N-acetylglucosamine 2-epimerase (non-hydrolysing)
LVSLLCVFGTRPEAIKLCPLVQELRSRPDEFVLRVCVTAQHREMLDQVLDVFGVKPDFDLDVMRPGQTLGGLTARILCAIEPVLADTRPDLVLVQGDTTTAFATALAAFYAGRAVGHVEAGLRTGDFQQPFPEELNRVLTAKLAALHFAPTSTARNHLLAERVAPDRIWVTGNTGIDAVLRVRSALESGTMSAPELRGPDPSKRWIAVTSHRRENFGDGFLRSMRALRTLASRGDVEIVYPVHRNPNVSHPARQILDGVAGVHLLEPLPYVPFVDLMRRSSLIITDSGGIQEEAPSLGKPVLVLREKTERPEAVEAGTVILAGTDEARIVGEASRLLDDADAYRAVARRHNPYGDGHACPRIADAIRGWFAANRE